MSADRAVPAGGADLGRRTIVMLLAVLVIGAPAVVLRLTCAGHSCDEPAAATATIPFCSLSGHLREGVAAGFREGRSPDVFGISGRTAVAGGTAAAGVPWPSTGAREAARVPLVFSGPGLGMSSDMPRRPRLDRVAPTIAAAVGLDRPHPEVRSGSALPVTFEDPPALVLEVVWKGVGSEDVRGAPTPILDGLMGEGMGTMNADPGSVPLDRAAILTTIGTGGLPQEHGITGTLVRNDDGELTRAWSKDSPPSVIAALGDDLDEYNDGAPRIGLVAGHHEDRGLIGGNWYLGSRDDDDVVITRDVVVAVRRLLGDGYGADPEPDLLAVTLSGKVTKMDRVLGEIVAAATRASDGRLLVVVTATGPRPRDGEAVSWTEVADEVDAALGAPVVEAVAPGGIFLDQAVLTRRQITEKEITDAMLEVKGPGGSKLLADAFPAIAISFLRYC